MHKKNKCQSLEDNIFIFCSIKSCHKILFVCALFLRGLSSLARSLLLCFFFLVFFLNLCFLLSLHQLQTCEILTLKLIELTRNIVQDGLDFRDGDILKRVHPAVGHLESLVQGNKTRLKGRKLNQSLKKNTKLLPHCNNFFATTNKTQTLVLSRSACFKRSEYRKLHTCTIVDTGTNTNARCHGSLRNLLLKVSSCVLCLGKGEEGSCSVT
mmetsp:Transcript_29232/g.59790  ORF Transcript_29232/g.59790 Transcript_29232/m.59790 type:complete len:211 (+) Transcript_29232:301-933(+)